MQKYTWIKNPGDLHQSLKQSTRKYYCCKNPIKSILSSDQPLILFIYLFTYFGPREALDHLASQVERRFRSWESNRQPLHSGRGPTLILCSHKVCGC